MEELEQTMTESELGNMLGRDAFVLRSQTDKITTVGPKVKHGDYLQKINEPAYLQEEFGERVELVSHVDCQSDQSQGLITIKIPTGRYTNGPYHFLITELGARSKAFYELPDELCQEYWHLVGLMLDVFHSKEPGRVFIAGTNYSPLEFGRHATQSLKRLHTHVYMFDPIDDRHILRQGDQLSKQEKRVVTDPFIEVALDLMNEVVFDEEFRQQEDIAYFTLPNPTENPEGLRFPRGYFLKLPRGLDELSLPNLTRFWEMIKKVAFRIDQKYNELVDCFVFNRVEANKDREARYRLYNPREIERNLEDFFDSYPKISEKLKARLITLAGFIKNPDQVLAKAESEEEALIFTNTRLFLKGPGYVLNLYRGIQQGDEVFLCITPRYLSGGGNPEAFGVLMQKEEGVLTEEQKKKNEAERKELLNELVRRHGNLQKGKQASLNRQV